MSGRVSGAPATSVVGARRGLVTLCITITTGYGVLFYAFPVLAPSITADTGWSLAMVTALFSASQVIAVLAGMARGILTLLQATAVSDRWGTTHYATLNAVMHTPLMLVIALAPWAGAALAWPLVGYTAVFVALGTLAALGATVALATRTESTQDQDRSPA